MLLEGDTVPRNPLDWSPDGQALLFGVGDLSATGRLWKLPLTGDRRPVPLTQDTYAINSARFSPDGHWIVYSSNESRRPEVYVVPVGGGAGKWQVSNNGGVQPTWKRDGKELFYWSSDNMLMSVPVDLKPGAREGGSARPLFRPYTAIGTLGVISPYDISPDGQRFVLITTPEQTPRPVTVVTNWTDELKK